MNAPLFIASDHAGFELKTHLLREVDLAPCQRQWADLGPASSDSVDYPVYAKKLSHQVIQTFSAEELLAPCGILICGSGIGVSIAANRWAGIRAALCWSEQVAQLSRNHNASNVLCLSGRLIDRESNLAIVRAWLGAKFEGGRHGRRVEMMERD